MGSWCPRDWVTFATLARGLGSAERSAPRSAPRPVRGNVGNHLSRSFGNFSCARATPPLPPSLPPCVPPGRGGRGGHGHSRPPPGNKETGAWPRPCPRHPARHSRGLSVSGVLLLVSAGGCDDAHPGRPPNNPSPRPGPAAAAAASRPSPKKSRYANLISPAGPPR